MGYDAGQTWPQWLVDDQREASGRPGRRGLRLRRADRADEDQRRADRQPGRLHERHRLRLGGQADRRLSRRGRRPAGDGRLPAHGLRRHLPRPLPRELRDGQGRSPPDEPLAYRFALPTANHVFLPGHRIMVQVQSSWFPLYDRNPQTFVPNIFWAKPEDYRKASQRIYHAPGQAASSSCPWSRRHEAPVRGLSSSPRDRDVPRDPLVPAADDRRRCRRHRVHRGGGGSAADPPARPGLGKALRPRLDRGRPDRLGLADFLHGHDARRPRRLPPDPVGSGGDARPTGQRGVALLRAVLVRPRAARRDRRRLRRSVCLSEPAPARDRGQQLGHTRASRVLRLQPGGDRPRAPTPLRRAPHGSRHAGSPVAPPHRDRAGPSRGWRHKEGGDCPLAHADHGLEPLPRRVRRDPIAAATCSGRNPATNLSRRAGMR